MEPYKGQLRFLKKSGQITSNDVKKVSEKLLISKCEAKELIKQRFFGEKKLQQFDGNKWCDIAIELENVIVDVDRYL